MTDAYRTPEIIKQDDGRLLLFCDGYVIGEIDIQEVEHVERSDGNRNHIYRLAVAPVKFGDGGGLRDVEGDALFVSIAGRHVPAYNFNTEADYDHWVNTGETSR